MKEKIKISAEPSLIFPLILLFWGNSASEILLFLLAVILHEAGHLICLAFFGHRPKAICFSLMGAEIEAGCELIPYRKEILLYLSGPLFNLFGCIVAFFLIRMDFREDFLFFFFCNALLGLFNLLPLPGLDGQRALFAFFCLFLEMDSAFHILLAIELLFLILVGFFSVLLFLTKKNPSLLIFLFWLISQQRKETSAAKKRAGPAERL